MLHALNDGRRQVHAGEAVEAAGVQVGCEGGVAAAQHQDFRSGLQVGRNQVAELLIALEPLILLLLSHKASTSRSFLDPSWPSDTALHHAYDRLCDCLSHQLKRRSCCNAAALPDA